MRILSFGCSSSHVSSMPRMTVLLAGQQHPLMLTANTDERENVNARAHPVTRWMICFLLPLDETTYPAVCYKRYRVYNKTIGKANISLYCFEVNSFCNAMRFTQGLMLSGLSSPKEVKGCEMMTGELWTLGVLLELREMMFHSPYHCLVLPCVGS